MAPCRAVLYALRESTFRFTHVLNAELYVFLYVYHYFRIYMRIVRLPDITLYAIVRFTHVWTNPNDTAAFRHAVS